MAERDSTGPRIEDVARAAGVSAPTVSRVLTGSAKVSESKKTRVLEAIRELGYRRNAAASSLASGKHTLIGVLAGQTAPTGPADTIQGIADAVHRSGYAVTVTVIESADPEGVRTAVDLVLSQPVGGVIVLEYDPQGLAALKALPSWVPCVVAGATSLRPRTVPVASLDARTAAKEATKYLLSLGHKTVHHLARPPAAGPSGRTAGWREALLEAGIEPPVAIECEDSAEAAYDSMGELLRASGVTAVLCANDELAFGAMRRIQESGLRIPEDISVMGFEGRDIGEFWFPPLSTVKLDFTEIGRRAGELMVQLIDTGSCPLTSTGTPQLVLRASTAAPGEQVES